MVPGRSGAIASPRPIENGCDKPEGRVHAQLKARLRPLHILQTHFHVNRQTMANHVVAALVSCSIGCIRPRESVARAIRV